MTGVSGLMMGVARFMDRVDVILEGLLVTPEGFCMATDGLATSMVQSDDSIEDAYGDDIRLIDLWGLLSDTDPGDIPS
eukprot:1394101-Amorphochlora_amoeboformis.AAC.1